MGSYYQLKLFSYFKNIGLTLLFITIGVVLRLLRHKYLPFYPNLEFFTLTALLGGVFLKPRWAAVVALSQVALSDVLLRQFFFIKNSPILIFTWSSWALIAISGKLLKKSSQHLFKFPLKITGLGVASNLFFFLYTNFGVWLLWNMYPHNFSGLISCYIMGLPFLKNQILGNLLILPLGSFVFLLGIKGLRYLLFQFGFRDLRLKLYRK